MSKPKDISFADLKIAVRSSYAEMEEAFETAEEKAEFNATADLLLKAKDVDELAAVLCEECGFDSNDVMEFILSAVIAKESKENEMFKITCDQVQSDEFAEEHGANLLHELAKQVKNPALRKAAKVLADTFLAYADGMADPEDVHMDCTSLIMFRVYEDAIRVFINND